MSTSKDIASDIQEIQWTDDAIRWQGGLHGEKSDGNNDEPPSKQSSTDDDIEEEEGCMVDPFKDPDPFQFQNFRFALPCGDSPASADNGDDRTHYIDIVIRGYKTNADEVWKSTGLTLWKASHYLCQYQIEHAITLFRGKRVLELGAGLGLNGILALKIMQSINLSEDNSTAENSVCITDGDSDALIHLRENIQRNRTTETNHHVRVSCHQLLWGASSSISFLQHVAQYRKYHVILASDIIYAPSIIQPLWETVQTLMDAEGVFVLAFARRKVPVSIDSVLREAENHGFSYQLAKEDTEEGIWVYAFKFA